MGLKEKYKKEIVPKLMKDLSIKNPMAVPHLQKVVLNIGLGKALTEPQYVDVAKDTLRRITGQEPVLTKAKKSISNFKLKQGLVVGAKVTLRGKRMYDFVEKLINVALPRMRDFRGISEKCLDNMGNLSLGFAEHIVFPEIRSDEVEKIHGLEVAININAKNKERGLKFFRALGLPFETK